jgi:hypothetical protein
MPLIHPPFPPTSATCRRVLIVLCLVACGFVPGCGADKYEARLRESKKYYAELEMIELNLAPKWSDGRAVEKMRVPKQFQAIPAPQPVKKEDGTEEMPDVDPRQPDFLNLVFPSNQLIGAWEAPFEVALPDGTTDSRKAHIYVLSNYWMFLGEDPNLALKFTPEIVELVGAALDDPLPPEKIENPPSELHPRPGGYFPSGSYSVFTFKPKAITQRSTERETTVNYTFEMFEKKNGDIQCIVLVVLPENISSHEKLRERIPMMLDHFAMASVPPRADASPNAPASGNAPAPF